MRHQLTSGNWLLTTPSLVTFNSSHIHQQTNCVFCFVENLTLFLYFSHDPSQFWHSHVRRQPVQWLHFDTIKFELNCLFTFNFPKMGVFFKSLQFSHVSCRRPWTKCHLKIGHIFALQVKCYTSAVQTNSPNKIEHGEIDCSLNELRNPAWLPSSYWDGRLKNLRSAEISSSRRFTPRSRSSLAHSNCNGPLNWSRYSVMACSNFYQNVSWLQLKIESCL